MIRAVALLALACANPRDPDHARAVVATLGPALAPLAADRVDYLRHQGWCKALNSRRGHFVETDHPTTCALSARPAAAFTPEARADLDRYVAGFGAVAPIGVEIDYDASGAPVSETVTVRAALGWSTANYVWAPARPPEPLEGELAVTPLGDGWYLTVEDWN